MKKPRRTKKRLLEGEAGQKLGEATLEYAAQNYPKAIELLQEVIRLSPNNPDPYHTLGVIYEEMNNERKALDFLMIAAHLSSKDAQLWYHLAEMSNRQKNPRQALYCLGSALKLDPEVRPDAQCTGARHIIHDIVYPCSPRHPPHSVPVLATSSTT